MFSARHLITVAAVAALTVASVGSDARATAEPSPSAGLGGAGAFIRPAHVNGPFGAGGPLAGIGGAGAFVPGSVGTASPPWSLCAFADHPAAADLGPLLAPTASVSPEVRAVLLGDVAVGTDCSVYLLPGLSFCAARCAVAPVSGRWSTASGRTTRARRA
jgi:hypothetical protein